MSTKLDKLNAAIATATRKVSEAERTMMGAKSTVLRREEEFHAAQAERFALMRERSLLLTERVSRVRAKAESTLDGLDRMNRQSAPAA